MKSKKRYRRKQKAKNRYRSLAGALSGTIVFFLMLGIGRAWFVNHANIETLVMVTPPSTISIRGAHGQSQTSLDMSYTDADKSSDGKVTIRRVISVCSDKNTHKLEIVHTTNLKGLQFKLYPATESDSTSSTDAVKENGYAYNYTKDSPLAGAYINGEGVELSENQKKEYGLANKQKHTQNFGEYNNVQAHAEPLYWKVTDTQTVQNENTDDSIDRRYVKYYVIEISWTEDKKESDIFYVLAKDADS